MYLLILIIFILCNVFPFIFLSPMSFIHCSVFPLINSITIVTPDTPTNRFVPLLSSTHLKTNTVSDKFCCCVNDFWLLKLALRKGRSFEMISLFRVITSNNFKFFFASFGVTSAYKSYRRYFNRQILSQNGKMAAYGPG